MGWGNCQKFEINRMRNYEQAKANFESIAPIKGFGRNSGLVPAGKRTKLQVRMEQDGTDIIVRLYQTAVVTYHADDNITLRIGGWASDSTRATIEEALGVGVVKFNGRLWLLINGERYWLPEYAETRVKYDGSKFVVHPDDVRPLVVHQVNRKEANNVRKQYSQVYEMLKRVFLLRTPMHDDLYRFEASEFDAVLDKGEGGQKPAMWYDPSIHHIKKFATLAASKEFDDAYTAAMWVIHGAGYHEWRLTTPSPPRFTDYSTIKLRYADAVMCLEKALFTYHRDKVFKVVECPRDVWRADKYKDIFSRTID